MYDALVFSWGKKEVEHLKDTTVLSLHLKNTNNSHMQ